MNNQVFGVFARDNDYYSQLELHKLFFNEQDAEVYAQQLREMNYTDDDANANDEMIYEEVEVCKLKVN
jgi:hypothetical protein